MKQSLVCEILISSSSAAALATASSSHTHARTHTQTHMQHTLAHMHTLYTCTDSDHQLEKKQIDAWPARPVYTVFLTLDRTGHNRTEGNRKRIA